MPVNQRLTPFASTMLLGALLIATSCERSDDSALKRELETKASASSHNVNVSFGYLHRFDKGRSDAVPHSGSLRTRSKDDGELEITEMYIVTSAIELHGCEPGFDEHASRRSTILNRLGTYLLPTAHAHVPSSSTRLGIPFVEDLLGPPEMARIIGDVAPPPGNYCRMYVILSPADDDLMNLTRAEPEDIEGKTLFVRGRWRKAGEYSWQDFSLSTSSRRTVRVLLSDPRTGTAPLRLNNPGAQTTVLIDKQVSTSLIEALDIDSLLDGSAANTIEDRLIDTFTMYRFRTSPNAP